MPVLKNPRHERFAQGICKGKSQHEAYLYAGYTNTGDQKDARSNGAHLAKKPEIAARIAEIQERQAKRVGITVDAILEELQDMLLLAKRTKQASAGVGAILAKAKILGLVTEKIETGVTVRKPSASPTDKKQMTVEEWHEKYAPRPPDQPLQ